MKRMDLSDKLFHAVKPNISWLETDDYATTACDIIKEKFKGIFEDSLIMCRQDLLTKPGNHKFSEKNFNGKDYVSLSRHDSALDNDSTYPGHVVNSESENAWQDYPFNYPALVFGQSLLKDNKEYIHAVRIPLEIQVKNSIDLKKAIAISVPGPESVTPFFENDIESKMALLSYQQSSRNKYDYMVLKLLLELTKQYHIDLPIINAWSGFVYRENLEYDEAIKSYVPKTVR